MAAAIAVHREFGPGLLETVYEVVLPDEIRKRGFRAQRQVPIAIVCRGVRFDEGFRADIIVESKVIIELKSVERITNAHKKQLLTYLKLTGTKERMDRLAADLLEHYRDRTSTLDGKAMAVCMTRENCVRLYNALTVLADCPEVKVIRLRK